MTGKAVNDKRQEMDRQIAVEVHRQEVIREQINEEHEDSNNNASSEKKNNNHKLELNDNQNKVNETDS